MSSSIADPGLLEWRPCLGAILLVYSSMSALFYCITLVPLYRLSKKDNYNMFILFFSHGIASTFVLSEYMWLSVEIIFQQRLMISGMSTTLINRFFFQAAEVHLIIIAINRVHSVCAPITFTKFWTKRVTTCSALFCWIGSAVVTLYSVQFQAKGAMFQMMFAYKTSLGFAFSTLSIYLMAIVWLLVQKIIKKANSISCKTLAKSLSDTRFHKMKNETSGYKMVFFGPGSFALMLPRSNLSSLILTSDSICDQSVANCRQLNPKQINDNLSIPRLQRLFLCHCSSAMAVSSSSASTSSVNRIQ
uniref:Uncharacterized protein n=1 Tax=Ditylenchus dipsaci TaxID=166011 RepID=A0A915EV37_9BILA